MHADTPPLIPDKEKEKRVRATPIVRECEMHTEERVALEEETRQIDECDTAFSTRYIHYSRRYNYNSEKTIVVLIGDRWWSQRRNI